MNAGRRKIIWKTSGRTFDLSKRPLLMAVINTTPDSFSDGGSYIEIEAAIAGAERALEEGADILDIGGESTRPGAERVSEEEEIERVVPVVEDLAKRFDAAISVDTSKQKVAELAIDAGAEIINDISGFRFEPAIAETIAKNKAGVVIMHSRGAFEDMHGQEPVENALTDVVNGLVGSLEVARAAGIANESICLDAGIGFGKSPSQNLEIVARLGDIISQFSEFPMLIGVSRKSFIGGVLGNVPPEKRLFGTIAANAAALIEGADIIRVHDVRPHAELIKVLEAIRNAGSE